MRIGTTSSYSYGVHARHDEADEHEGADPHMRELEQCHPVEEHAHGVNVRDVAGAVEREAGRHVHPCVDRNNGIRANNTGGEDRDERAQQGTQWHPAPAEQVDPKKNRFDKERQPLDSKRQAICFVTATYPSAVSARSNSVVSMAAFPDPVFVWGITRRFRG